MVKKMQDVQEQDEAAASQWKFEIGQSVRLAGGQETAEVIWRRESQGGERDYLVNPDSGPQVWLAEDALVAA